MKRADIIPGKVYALNRSRDDTNPDKIVFLTPLDSNHFYRHQKYAKAGQPHYTPEHRYIKPQKGYFSTDGSTDGFVGYLAAQGDSAEHGTLEEAIRYGTPRHPGPDGEVDESRCAFMYTIITSTTMIAGLYDEVTAKIKERKEKGRQEREAAEKYRAGVTDEYLELHKTLLDLGVDVSLQSSSGRDWNYSEYTRKNSPPTGFHLSIRQARELARRITELEEA